MIYQRSQLALPIDDATLVGMKAGQGALRVFDSLIDRILCVVGAILFSQGPEFMQQYLQRLGGHLAEAHRQVDNFRAAAAKSSITLDQLITRTSANTDASVARLGTVMSDTVERAHSLQSAHDALLQSSLWERPMIFIRHLDMEIARATGAIFKPAVPTTLEGALYALMGIIVFLGLYHILFKRLFTTIGRKSPSVKAAAAT